MAATMRQYDWDHSAIGPVNLWPDALKIAVRIVLTTAHPMSIWWGEELSLLYNDAYKDIIGEKHPDALGKPAHEVWPEVWPQIVPFIKKVIGKGESWSGDRALYYINRHHRLEETYYTFSFSPITEICGNIGGILCVTHEVTEQVVNERRLKTVSQISGIRNSITTQESRNGVMDAIASNPNDFPFALLYTAIDDKIKLNSYTRDRFKGKLETEETLKSGSALIPEGVDITQPSIISIPDSLKRKLKLPSHGVLPNQAAILPVTDAGQDLVRGYFVLGLSAVLPLNQACHEFLKLLSSQIDAVVTSIRALEQERLHSQKLVELDNLKNAFFRNVSHALRNPITNILDKMDALKLDGKDTDTLANIRKTSQELLQQVNSLLSFSAVELGQYTEGFVPQDLAVLADELSRNVRQQNLLETILDAISDSFVYLTLDLKFVFVNKRVFEIRGRTRQEYVGKHITELYPYIVGSELYEKVQKALSTLQPQFVEYFDVTISVWYEIRIYPSEQGVAVYLANVTERKRQEQEKRELEERFSEMANAAPVLLWMADSNANWTFFNNSWLEFRGRTLEQEKNRGWQEGVHPDDLQQYISTFRNAFEKQEPFMIEYRLLYHENEYRWIMDAGVPRFREGNIFDGYIGACTDITDRKRAETILSQYNQQLEESVAQRTDELVKANEQLQMLTSHLQELQENERKLIARDIHDELGQALAAFKIELSLFQDSVAQSKARYKEQWLENLEGMERAVDESIGTMRRVIFRLRPSLSDDLELVHDLEKLVSDLSNRVKIDFRFKSDVRALYLEPDIAIEIYRIMQEALTNVIKHSKAKEAVVYLKKEPGLYRFVVEDNGQGFSVKTRKGSVTFGILGIRERSQRIGAELHLETEAGRGTRVELILPAPKQTAP